MKRVAEILLTGIWPLLPYKVRLSITEKVEAFRARAILPIPVNQIEFLFFEAKSKAIFASRAKSSGVSRKLPSSEIDGSLSKVTDILAARNDCKIPHPAVSLVITCRNEMTSIKPFLHGLEIQSHKPKEIIICDGGSTDGTLAELEKWRDSRKGSETDIKILSLPGSPNIAKGRNEAAKKATTEYLLFADMGTVVDIEWVRRISAAFSLDQSCDVVMGWYEAMSDTPWQRELASFLLPDLENMDVSKFFPSARSLAVRKTLFDAIGGFPEYLSHSAEDSLFDFYLKKNARTIYFVPDARVFWKMPDRPLKAWMTVQRYARGDAETGFLFWSHYFNLLQFALPFLVELGMLILFCTYGWSVFGNKIALVAFILLLVSLISRWYSFLVSNSVFFHRNVAIKLWQFPLHPRLISRLFAFHLLSSAQFVGFLRGLSQGRRRKPIV